MAPNQSPTASPLTIDPESTLPYERKGTFEFLELTREIREEDDLRRSRRPDLKP